MITIDRVDVQQTQSFAHFTNRNKTLINRFAIQLPFDVDGQITSYHITRNARGLSEIRWFFGKGKGRDLWQDYVGVYLKWKVKTA